MFLPTMPYGNTAHDHPSSGFSKKHILIAIAVILILLVGVGVVVKRRMSSTEASSGSGASVTTGINKTYTVSAISNKGEKTPKTLSFTIKDVEKTNQVIVKDQTFISKNNKMFFIANLEIKNTSTQPLNIVPGDLVRITYGADQSNQYAPDLHNNLVLISPISTKLDRIGFVIPSQVKDIDMYVGELEGKKEKISVHLPS